MAQRRPRAAENNMEDRKRQNSEPQQEEAKTSIELQKEQLREPLRRQFIESLRVVRQAMVELAKR